jgi:hypothetical protein
MKSLSEIIINVPILFDFLEPSDNHMYSGCQPPIQWVPGSFPGGLKRGRCVTLTANITCRSQEWVGSILPPPRSLNGDSGTVYFAQSVRMAFIVISVYTVMWGGKFSIENFPVRKIFRNIFPENFPFLKIITSYFFLQPLSCGLGLEWNSRYGRRCRI